MFVLILQVQVLELKMVVTVGVVMIQMVMVGLTLVTHSSMSRLNVEIPMVMAGGIMSWATREIPVPQYAVIVCLIDSVAGIAILMVGQIQ